MRKANAKKILDELIIDDFLGDGPKGGGVSDRFDQTFFMGDLKCALLSLPCFSSLTTSLWLSFRLNVSRLHADWILTSKDYATALEFDQLREVLAEPDSVFKGFSEGPIAFAPTCELHWSILSLPALTPRDRRQIRHCPQGQEAALNHAPPSSRARAKTHLTRLEGVRAGGRRRDGQRRHQRSRTPPIDSTSGR